MRVLGSILAILFAPALMIAQETMEGFEEWVSSPDGRREIPKGWSSSGFGVGRSDDAYAGKYSAAIWNWYSYVVGYITVGEGEPDWVLYGQGGVPVDFTPSQLSGMYRYVLGQSGWTEQGNDSAAVIVTLKRYDAEQGRSRILSSVKHLLGPSNEWRPFHISIPPPEPGVEPDSIAIIFLSSDPENSAYCGPDSSNCCYLYLDEVSLGTTSGVSNSIRYQPIDALLRSAVVTPNPVTETIRIRFPGTRDEQYRLLLFDAAGRRVDERIIAGTSVELEKSGRASGAYFFTILDTAGNPVSQGEFIIW